MKVETASYIKNTVSAVAWSWAYQSAFVEGVDGAGRPQTLWIRETIVVLEQKYNSSLSLTLSLPLSLCHWSTALQKTEITLYTVMLVSSYFFAQFLHVLFFSV